MVKTCSLWVPKGSGSKPFKTLKGHLVQSHSLCLLQSHLTGGCCKCQYSPACPRVFMMGTATFKRKARKQSLGTQCVGKYPARKTERRNAANNSIQKPEAWVLAGTWSFHNSNSNSTGSKYRKGSWKITGEKSKALPQWKHFLTFKEWQNYLHALQLLTTFPFPCSWSQSTCTPSQLYRFHLVCVVRIVM